VLRDTRRSSKPKYGARYPDARSTSALRATADRPFFRDANTGAGQGITDLVAAVQLRLHVALGLQTLTVKSRLLTGENTVQVRGDPPSFALRATDGRPRRLGRRSAKRAGGSRSSKYQSATLRTSRLQVRVLPGVPLSRACGSTRIAEGPDSESGSLGGASPFMPTSLRLPATAGRPIGNVNRTSDPGLFAKQRAPGNGGVVQVHGVVQIRVVARLSFAACRVSS
jgi:hypothetical protein